MPQFLPNPDVDPAQLIEDLAAALASHYTGIEARLQAELARRLRKGLEQYPDLTERARVVRELDAEARNALGGTNARTLAASVISIATAQGTAAAADWLGLAKHLPRTLGYTTTSANAGLMLTIDLANKLESLHLRILRYPSDEYQRIVAAISPDVLGGTSTLRVTQAQIVSQFLAEGITGFVDKADRRWRIGTYAEMATRTAVNRAWSDAGVYRMQQSGINLVTPSVAVDACERCSAWAGKILSTDGVTGVRLVQHAIEDRMVQVTVDATLEEARAAGLQHPNCRDTMLPVMPGLPAPPVSAADPAKAEARDKLRALEREVRSAKRDVVTAPTEAARAEAHAAVLEAQADVREHVKRTGATRRNYREQLHFSDGSGPILGSADRSPGGGPRPLMSNSSALGKDVRHAISQIRAVHSIPADLPAVPIRRAATGSKSRGRYTRRGSDPVEVAISTEGSTPTLTTAHELGHYFDHVMLGQSGALESVAGTTPQMRRAVSMLAGTDSARQIRAYLSDPNPQLRAHAEYLLQPSELWGRAYAQYIALRSGSAQMLAELAGQRAAGHALSRSRQWSRTEFEPVAVAIDELLRARGVLK